MKIESKSYKETEKSRTQKPNCPKHGKRRRALISHINSQQDLETSLLAAFCLYLFVYFLLLFLLILRERGAAEKGEKEEWEREKGERKIGEENVSVIILFEGERNGRGKRGRKIGEERRKKKYNCW